MITFEMLCMQIGGLREEELRIWIARGWVRPDGEPGAWLFHEIDEARVRLIVEMRELIHPGEEALPVVLSLLDQLYDERRRMRRIGEALERSAPETLRQEILRLLASGA